MPSTAAKHECTQPFPDPPPLDGVEVQPKQVATMVEVEPKQDMTEVAAEGCVSLGKFLAGKCGSGYEALGPCLIVLKCQELAQ